MQQPRGFKSCRFRAGGTSRGLPGLSCSSPVSGGLRCPQRGGARAPGQPGGEREAEPQGEPAGPGISHHLPRCGKPTRRLQQGPPKATLRSVPEEKGTGTRGLKEGHFPTDAPGAGAQRVPRASPFRSRVRSQAERPGESSPWPDLRQTRGWSKTSRRGQRRAGARETGF